ncbi:MAG: hypothetical protein ACTSYC_12795 [Promethearchaeota archaeon]
MVKNILKRIYIGTINERDPKIFKEIKDFCFIHYNIKFVDLLEKNEFSEKYFQKKLKKYPISFLIVKLYSKNSNEKIYDALNTLAPHIPLLNSIEAVRTCESRIKTFTLMRTKCKEIRIPRFYSNKDEVLSVLSNNKEIIIKLDSHNPEHFNKEDRILGIVSNQEDFSTILSQYKFDEIFCQEYLGNFDVIYKVYVINNWIVSITSTNRLQGDKYLSPLDLVHLRVPIDNDLKNNILKIGKQFRMSIFGIDYVIKNNVPYIIDINDFPSFKRIPEAVCLISDYIYNLLSLREHAELLKSHMTI